MRDRNMSRYRLSKESGVPWATLSDICTGKTRMDRCSAGTMLKLSQALGISLEELLQLEIESSGGKPTSDEYLEAGLPEDLRKAIREFLEGEQARVPYLDCLWDEVYGSINANQWGGRITEEQANHLREKYLYDSEKDGDGDD